MSNIHSYGDLLEAEYVLMQPRLKAVLQREIQSITYIRPTVDDHSVFGYAGITFSFKEINQKFIYSELIRLKSTTHIHQIKWTEHIDIALDWDAFWDSLHQQFFTENLKSIIWEQTHLNYYTTYNYNKWHNSMEPCPLCRKFQKVPSI